MEKVALYFENCWDIVLELAPWLMFGMLIAGILHTFLPEGFIAKHLGRRRWIEVFKAVAFGVPLPLCSCGVIPAAMGLKKDGASDGAAVGFLISTPQTGVDSLLVSATFLGWPFAIFKIFSALVSGMIGGLLVNLFDKTSPAPDVKSGDNGKSPDLTTGACCHAEPVAKPACPHCSTAAPVNRVGNAVADPTGRHGQNATSGGMAKAQRGPVLHRLIEMLRFGIIDLLRDIYRWIIIGVLVAAGISTLLPAGRLESVWWMQGLAGMLVMLAISIPMYICATASIPLAASLVAAGMSPGSALVLLMAGPTTNVATLGAVYRTFGGKILGIYLATVAGCSLLLAILFDRLIAAPFAHAAHHVHPLPHGINFAAAVILIALLAYFIVADIQSRLRR